MAATRCASLITNCVSTRIASLSPEIRVELTENPLGAEVKTLRCSLDCADSADAAANNRNKLRVFTFLVYATVGRRSHWELRATLLAYPNFEPSRAGYAVTTT